MVKVKFISSESACQTFANIPLKQSRDVHPSSMYVTEGDDREVTTRKWIPDSEGYFENVS